MFWFRPFSTIEPATDSPLFGNDRFTDNVPNPGDASVRNMNPAVEPVVVQVDGPLVGQTMLNEIPVESTELSTRRTGAYPVGKLPPIVCQSYSTMLAFACGAMKRMIAAAIDATNFMESSDLY